MHAAAEIRRRKEKKTNFKINTFIIKFQGGFKVIFQSVICSLRRSCQIPQTERHLVPVPTQTGALSSEGKNSKGERNGRKGRRKEGVRGRLN